MKNILMSMMMLSLLASCGGGSSSGSSQNTLQEEQARSIEEAEAEAEIAATDGTNIQGSYIAKFTTLNTHVVGTIPGAVHLKREGEQIYTFVRLFAGSPSVAHFQNIHAGNRCPTLADDTNLDGYLDIQETLAVVGPVIVPLDWDISTQLSGNRSWPKAFENGSYEYLKEANFDRFWNDLKEEDRNIKDNITKLAPDEGLAVTGKVVIIQGVGEEKIIPDSVLGYQRWNNRQTFPIACGIFYESTEQPGIPYAEGIPGPVATVEEGQDRPAPAGEGEIPGTGTVITGNTNDAGSNDSGSEDDPDEVGVPAPTPVPTPVPAPPEEEDEDDDDWHWPWETSN